MYAYNSLMEDLNIKKKHGISKAIEELESLGFIRSKKEHGKATIYYLTSDQKVTTTSDQKGTLIIINNKNNINKNNINNNNKENVVAGVIRQEIHFLIKSRNIKIDNVLKYCSNLDRIKEVFRYADKHNKADAWIIACLRDGYKLEAIKEKHKKNYDLTFDDI